MEPDYSRYLSDVVTIERIVCLSVLVGSLVFCLIGAIFAKESC